MLFDFFEDTEPYRPQAEKALDKYKKENEAFASFRVDQVARVIVAVSLCQRLLESEARLLLATWAERPSLHLLQSVGCLLNCCYLCRYWERHSRSPRTHLPWVFLFCGEEEWLAGREEKNPKKKREGKIRVS